VRRALGEPPSHLVRIDPPLDTSDPAAALDAYVELLDGYIEGYPAQWRGWRDLQVAD